MNINQNLINPSVNNDQMSSNSGHSYSSEYTVNSLNEIIFLVSFYDTVALDNRRYFDENYDMVMSENKPFICCSTLSFNNHIQQANIYVGEGALRPWIGYVINQKLALIIAHSLKDAWTDKDTFNFKKVHAKVEQKNINLVLDKNIKLDKEVQKKIDKGVSLTEADLRQLRKNLAPDKYYRVSRIYNGREHIVYVSYDTLCKKCKDALKDIRTNQKQANSDSYTEETVSTNLGKALKISQMMIDLNRVKQNFGQDSNALKRNQQFQKGVENIIKFLMKKQLNEIYVIDDQQLHVWNTSEFLQQLAGANILAKYQIDNNGHIVPRQQQNMQNNIINTNMINVSKRPGVNKNYNNEAIKGKQDDGTTAYSSCYGNNGLKTSRLRFGKDNSKNQDNQRHNSANERNRDKNQPLQSGRLKTSTRLCDYPNEGDGLNHRRNNRYTGRTSPFDNQLSPYTVRRDSNNTRTSSTEKCCCCNCCNCGKRGKFCNIF